LSPAAAGGGGDGPVSWQAIAANAVSATCSGQNGTCNNNVNVGSSVNVGSVRWMSKKSKRKDSDDVSNQQHEEWVKFQQSISVSGFETGQIKTLTRSGLSGRKDRGGKQLRRRREKELALQDAVAERDKEMGTGAGSQFPALRYSDEETERLLAEAYANIPERAGKRGTRSLKRQRNRWFKVRKIHRKKKEERIREHGRRMEKRSAIVGEVMRIKEDANEIRTAERDYQEEVLRAWAAQAVLDEGDDGVMRQVVAKSGDGK